jgi:hypothetical protein
MKPGSGTAVRHEYEYACTMHNNMSTNNQQVKLSSIEERVLVYYLGRRAAG